MKKTFRLASIDVGYCNFAQYIEDCDIGTIRKLEQKFKSLPKKKQRLTGGVMYEEIEDILNKLCLSGTRINTGVYDFSEEDTNKLDNKVRLKLLKHLSNFKELWDTCDFFIIEQQFSPPMGGKARIKKDHGANIDAVKIGEAVYMWFLERYPTKYISYFGSQYKTQIFGAPWKLKKPERKKWAINKAHIIYKQRKDKDMINVYDLAEAVKGKQIKTQKRIDEFKGNFPCKSDDADILSENVIRRKQKLCDISDAMVMAQAFKYKTMVACF